MRKKEEIFISHVLFPWETFAAQAEREQRERKNGGARWTESFRKEVRENILRYADTTFFPEEKYGVSEDELDEEERRRHDFEYHGKEQEKLLRQVVYKVTGGYAYNLVYRASGRKVKTRLGADCTAAEKVEIEFLFDFYTRLWERERDAFLSAFIQKHRIFTIRDDIEPQEVSREELLKMQALMLGMSDESPVRALPAQQ